MAEVIIVKDRHVVKENREGKGMSNIQMISDANTLSDKDFFDKYHESKTVFIARLGEEIQDNKEKSQED